MEDLDLSKFAKGKPFTILEGMKFAQINQKKLFIGMNGANFFSRERTKGVGVEVFPGIFSGDVKYRIFLKDLVGRLNSDPRLDVRVSNYVFGSNGVSGNFNQLLNLSGFRMHPMGYSSANNELLRDSMGLRRYYKNDRHRAIFKKLVELVYSDWIPKAPSISKKSSSGAPFFSTDVEFKYKHFKHVQDNWLEIEHLILDKKDLATVYDRHMILFSTTQSNRTSADSIEIDEMGNFVKAKERKIADWDYAMSGGAMGSMIIANKQVVIDGSEVKGFSSLRDRPVWAPNNAINLNFSAPFEGFRTNMETKYAYTWKHIDRENIEGKIGKWNRIWPLDVTQYDSTIPKFLLDDWFEFGPFRPEVAEISKLLFTGPKFYKWQDGRKQYWTGDPLDLRYYNQYGGLTSGTYPTSSFGKVCFVWAMLVLIDDQVGRAYEDMEDILTGDGESGIINMSDDTLLGSNSPILTKAIDQMVEEGISISEYFKVDIEFGLEFLGNIGLRENENDQSSESIKLFGSVISFLKNMLVPEVGISSKQRPYPIYGLLTRIDVFKTNPSFSIVYGIFLEAFKDHYDLDWYSFMKAHEVVPKSDLNVNIRSLADIEVLLDPSKLHYKYTRDDISKDVADEIESVLPIEDCIKAVITMTKFSADYVKEQLAKYGVDHTYKFNYN